MNFNRISIIGISGSGKSVLGRILAAKTRLPLVHMDQLFWKGNWQEVPEAEYLAQHAQLVQQDQWIIEGYIDQKMSDRLQRSDLILFLDYPGWFCCWRVVVRWLKHRRRSRPELPPEALERLKGEFLWRVWRRKERAGIEQALHKVETEKLVILHRPGQVQQVLNQYFS